MTAERVTSCSRGGAEQVSDFYAKTNAFHQQARTRATREELRNNQTKERGPETTKNRPPFPNLWELDGSPRDSASISALIGPARKRVCWSQGSFGPGLCDRRNTHTVRIWGESALIIDLKTNPAAGSEVSGRPTPGHTPPVCGGSLVTTQC